MTTRHDPSPQIPGLPVVRLPPAEPFPDDDGGSGGAHGGRAVSRRRFLALAGGVGAVGALGAALGPRAWDVVFGGGSDNGSLASPGSRRLVLVTLYGGNDGLNTVVPYQDPTYLSARGSLAIDPTTVLPIGEGFGLHPALTGFKSLWDAGNLGIVQGVGFANPNYSHFESMDIWQSGVPGTPVSTGWIGRWLDGMGSSPLRAVGIGPTTPVVLHGAQVQGASIAAGPMRLPGGTSEQALFAALGGTTRSEALLLAASARSNADLITVQRQIGSIVDRSASSDPLHSGSGAVGSSSTGTALGALAIADGGGGLSSPGVLATQLSLVANLILAGSPTEVFSVELGGFDTHTDQALTQHTLLGEVGDSVSAFVDALRPDPIGKETVVVVYTEFGRRVAGNASGGTDHGWANVVFVAGDAVKGGWYGDVPDLGKLSDGNLVFTTDFRSVYSTLFSQVLGVDPSPFLSGRFPTLPFI